MSLDLAQFMPVAWPRDAAGNRVKFAAMTPAQRERQEFQAMEALQAVLDSKGWDGRLMIQTKNGAALIDAAKPRKVSK